MHHRQGMTIYELVVIIVILALVGAIVIVSIGAWLRSGHGRVGQRTQCMANLYGIGKGLVLYKTQYDGKWPWMGTTTPAWDTTATGTSRDIDPNSPEGRRAPRSITSLMFVLLRENQTPDAFVCPADAGATKDLGIVKVPGIGDEPDELYWDFSSARNVSYSWQAPVFREGQFVNGLGDDQLDAVVMGDKTPRAVDPAWRPEDMSQPTTFEVIRRNMSPNHDGGEKINCLMVGMNVQQEDRPDCGFNKDNIYTASGRTDGGSQSSASLNLTDHLSTADSFLIGPVPAGR